MSIHGTTSQGERAAISPLYLLLDRGMDVSRLFFIFGNSGEVGYGDTVAGLAGAGVINSNNSVTHPRSKLRETFCGSKTPADSYLGKTGRRRPGRAQSPVGRAG
jgi:hypothetical protein